MDGAHDRGGERSRGHREVQPKRLPDSGKRGPDHVVVERNRKTTVYLPGRDRRVYGRDRRVYVRRYDRHPVVLARPFVHVDIHWPWMYRYNRRWAPRYRYRQVIYVTAGRGHRHRKSRIEVETTYRHQVRHADQDYAEVDIYIEEIGFYQDGRYLGSVHHIPGELSHIRATVYRGGAIEFDRDAFVVGDAGAGFEMISMRHQDGNVFDAYAHGKDVRVGRVDLRGERVRSSGHSRLFDPYDFTGYVPVSLLPEGADWLMDYGPEALSALDDPDYYYGRGEGTYGGSDAGQRLPSRSRVLEHAFRAENGTEVSIRQEAVVQRIR